MKFASSTSTSVRALTFLSLSTVSVLSQDSTTSNITSDSYFYGQSPLVPPAALPSGTTSSWASAYSKAADFVSQLSQEEKSNLTFGVRATTSGCVGFIPPIERLGFKGLCLQDAGNGVRLADGVNAYDSGLHVGAT
tara:strand:+ start:976 stop:1383 length:408 start_codon:yes stop_codon:yes gene_type:complete